MLVTSIFSFFPTMFSCVSKTNFTILAIFRLLSANALNLDKSIILLFVKELTKAIQAVVNPAEKGF